MGLTVRDLFDLNIMRNFQLLAGAGGLDKPIKRTEIVDYEFVQGVRVDRVQMFDGESLAISSLLFAKDDPSLILDTVMRLYEQKVSCFAYKAIFIDDLPEEVLRFADTNDFPILRFGGDEFFEDVVLQVTNELNRGSDIMEIERDLEKVLDQETDGKEELKLCRRINPNLKKYIGVVAVWDEKREAEEVETLVRRHLDSDRLRRKTALCKFRRGYFIIISQNEPEESRFLALLEDLCVQLGLERKNCRMGFSTIRLMEEDFGRCVREAFWACIVARMEKVAGRRYNEMGIYRFIVPQINSPNARAYMEEYLEPVLRTGESDLLDTAKAYIMNCGDVVKTAEQLFCHKNTVRYRLAKIQEMVDPQSNDKAFYESLSIAIRIYLLTKFNQW